MYWFTPIWPEYLAEFFVSRMEIDITVLCIHLQQEAGILHCVFENLSGTIVVIDLHVQIPKRGASFHRFEL